MDYKVHRYYRISMTFGPFVYCENTRVYTLKMGFQTKIIGILYTIFNILTGFLGFGFNRAAGYKNTFNAIMINIAGGIDITPADVGL